MTEDTFQQLSAESELLHVVTQFAPLAVRTGVTKTYHDIHLPSPHHPEILNLDPRRLSV